MHVPGCDTASSSSCVETSGVRNLFSMGRILPAMDATQTKGLEGRSPQPERGLPPVTRAEREFWRRAVAAERARQRCGRPAPFPFQPA
jgi:hypothetical protein